MSDTQTRPPLEIGLGFRELPQLQPDQMDRYVRARYRHLWHDKVFLALREQGLIRRDKPRAPYCDRIRAICTRYSANQPDYNNLCISFKPLIDGLVKYGVIPDDSPKHLEDEYFWERAKRGEGKVTLSIKEVS